MENWYYNLSTYLHTYNTFRQADRQVNGYTRAGIPRAIFSPVPADAAYEMPQFPGDEGVLPRGRGGSGKGGGDAAD